MIGQAVVGHLGEVDALLGHGLGRITPRQPLEPVEQADEAALLTGATSARICCSPAPSVGDRASTSRLARMLVSGVRSPWPASSANRRDDCRVASGSGSTAGGARAWH